VRGITEYICRRSSEQDGGLKEYSEQEGEMKRGKVAWKQGGKEARRQNARVKSKSQESRGQRQDARGKIEMQDARCKEGLCRNNMKEAISQARGMGRERQGASNKKSVFFYLPHALRYLFGVIRDDI
jgi:hypothetical protein